MSRKKKGIYHPGEGHVDTGFSLKQCQKYFNIEPAVRKKANCNGCDRKFDAWFQGSKRVEWFCQNCKKLL